MKKVLVTSMMIFVLSGFLVVVAADDISKHPACPLCGMDRAKFAHSRIYIEYDDNSTLGTCSIRCAAVDMYKDTRMIREKRKMMRMKKIKKE